VNCTTIDWFLPWPEEALISTAQYKIMNVKFQGAPEEVNTIIS
jgi:dynein heavy chain